MAKIRTASQTILQLTYLERKLREFVKADGEAPRGGEEQ